MFSLLPSMPFLFTVIFISLLCTEKAKANYASKIIKKDHNIATNTNILASLEKAQQQPLNKSAVFSASAQLGLLYLTGNTRSADMKAGLDLRFEKGLWSNIAAFNSLIKKTE